MGRPATRSSTPDSRVASRWMLALYVVVAGSHLAAQAADSGLFVLVSKALLMPILAAHLLVAVRAPHSRLVRLALAALGFSWLGDTVPGFLDGNAAFLTMVGFFLLTQATYVFAFLPYRAASVLITGRGWLVLYLAAFAGLLVACVPGAGVLAPAVVVYGAVLLAMAVLSTGVHPLAWAGSAVFLVSDGLIALGRFVVKLPGVLQPLVVMTTYLVAQLLLVRGVIARTQRANVPT